MGSGASTEKMIIHDLSKRTSFGQSELTALKERFHELALRQGNPNTITVAQLGEALGAVGIDEGDAVILNKVFNMMDRSQDGEVYFKDFVVCCSHLMSTNLEENLSYSFMLYATDEGLVTDKEMKTVLIHANNSASWFGDHALSEEEIDELVKDVFEKHGNQSVNPPTLSFVEYSKSVQEHPILAKFVCGQGSNRRDSKLGPAITFEAGAAAAPTDAPPVESVPAPTEEAASAPAAAEEAAPEFAPTEEAAPVPAPTEEAAPAPASTEEAAPAPASTEEASPAPAPTEEAAPEPAP